MTAHLKPTMKQQLKRIFTGSNANDVNSLATLQSKNINNSKYQLGATLVELIITIVIISTALTGIMSVVNITTGHSADPMVQHQAIAIAESYLEEILLLPTIDPDGTNTGETRATFDNIADYQALSDIGAKNQLGETITGLSLYTIDVTITSPMTINGISMTRVKVDVSRQGTDTISLSGYKAN